MKFLPDEKQPKAYYEIVHRYVGTINIADGLIDITDPGYESDTWCAKFGFPIKPGNYRCYINVGNFPSKVKYEESDYEVIIKSKRPNHVYTLQDRRVVDLTIEHEDIKLTPQFTSLSGWELLDDNIGVDAGLCGFYNHKPNLENSEDWDNFWQNLKNYPRLNFTCDIKPYGITVSSGFGDGQYSVYKFTDYNGETVALRLKFC